jgi:hypothetical protein
LKSSKSKVDNRGKRLIAIPKDKHRPYLYFESQKDIRDFFQLSVEKFKSALEDGIPVCLGDVVYYIDEDLSE